ncbi:MAG: hypothetical protein OEY11_15125 [Gammaproteobacteria bacterium]|nr:hypothetical protein [Gammaproteobacteria bacterium]
MNAAAHNQQNLFTSWIDFNDAQPEDGQQIVEFYNVDDPNDVMSKKLCFKYGDLHLIGPIVKTFHTSDIDLFKPIAYWQPVEPLPKL